MLTITRMRATFGRLSGSILELKPGLNVISGPNEAGKSTWAEFLIAMFYGVDTRQRGRSGQLPVKTKYMPWNGSPMAGVLELNRDGRTLILERSSEPGPMAALSVRDAASGLEAGEFVGANCGESLLGVEASVYRRSGYLRQRSPAISADPLLEKRLSSMVTAGAEDYAYGEIDGKLKKLENSIQYNQSGELPRLRARLAETDSALQSIRSLRARQTSLSAEIRCLESDLERLEGILAGIAALEQQQTLLEARQAAEAAAEDRIAWEQVCAELPEDRLLDAFRRQLTRIRETAQAAAMEDAEPVSVPDDPVDAVFSQMDAQQARDKAARDASFVREAEKMPSLRIWNVLLRFLPGFALALAAIFAPGLLPENLREAARYGFAAIAAILLMAAAVFCVRSLRAGKRTQKTADRLLKLYGAKDPEAILQRASEYIGRLRACEAQRARANQVLTERRRQAEALRQETNALLAGIRSYVPDCDSLTKAEAYLHEAGVSKSSLELARREERRRSAELERLENRLRDGSDPQEDPAGYSKYQKPEIQLQLHRCRSELTMLRSESDRIEGAIGQLGDPFRWEALREEQEKQIAALEKRYAAVRLARSALAQADQELRSRFAPLLCKRASQLFFRLTGGKYDRVSLDREFRVTVHPVDSTVDRNLDYLSGGTVDQLYLALRLAICDLLLPGKPIVLDDALVYFDEKRAELALQTLQEMSQDRQIVLFTCQSREKQLLDEINCR